MFLSVRVVKNMAEPVELTSVLTLKLRRLNLLTIGPGRRACGH